MLERTLGPSLDRGVCPHLAVLLRREDDLHEVLASFYALGAKRNGWLAHRSVAGEADADRDRLGAAGLDVTGLEREERLAIVEFDPDEAPESSPEPWRRALTDALDRGHSALWYSRFAVGANPGQFERVVEFERAWDQAFADMPVVTLCPYVVADMSGAGSLERLRDVSAFHDGVLVPSSDRELALFEEASSA